MRYVYIFRKTPPFFSSEILATSLLHRLLLHPRDHVNSRLGRGLGGPENEPLLGLASCRYLEITSCTYSFMGLAIKIRGMNQLTWWFYHFFRGQLGVNSTECNHKAGPKPIFAGFVVDIPWYTSNILCGYITMAIRRIPLSLYQKGKNNIFSGFYVTFYIILPPGIFFVPWRFISNSE